MENFSQIDGDSLAGFHQLGMQVGGTVMIPFYNNWSAGVEILYSQKGSQTTQNNKFPEDNFDLLLNYIEIPVMVRYSDKEKFTGGVGFSYGRYLSNKLVINSLDEDLADETFKESDLMIKLDAGYFINESWYVNAGWASSLARVDNQEASIPINTDNGYINRVVFLRLMYILPIGASANN